MELFDLLKQFKNIAPDPAYKETSKRAILATAPREPRNVWRTVTAIFETGIAVGLTVFFILIMTGQFPSATVSNYVSNTIPGVSPAQLSVINPATLRAEAQAVDVQIQLAQMTYQVSTTTAESTPEVAAAIAAKKPSMLPTATAATSTAGGTAEATSTASSTLSVDQALQELSQ